MSADPSCAGGPRPVRNPVLRFLSSIWLGVSLLALILIYSSVLSALAPVRWTLEMTEMQAFRHWLFVGLAGLLFVSLLAATTLRTRWTVSNGGSIVAHLGLLLLLVGATAYFASKVEGDVLVQAPAIEIRATVGDRSGVLDRFRAWPDEIWSRNLPHRPGPLTIRVRSVEADGIQPVARATVEVRAGDGDPNLLTLQASTTWQPVSDMLDLRLVNHPPQQYFYDAERPALYLRPPGASTDILREIPHLPIYHEHYSTDEGLLKDSHGTPVPPRRERPEIMLGSLRIPTGWFERWRMPIRVDSSGLPFDIEITGYVPYALDLRPASGPDGVVRLEPLVATPEQRRPDVAARAMSAIRLRLTGRGEHAGWSETHWCLFSLYPDVEARPLEVHLPGEDKPWELVYSRVRHPLGARIAAGRLGVEYFPGRRGIRGYHSKIMIDAGDGPHAATVHTNHTVTVGPWTLFQSGFAQDQWSYSILGVGNRVGMPLMQLGWILVAIGCLYAFYVKPVLLRRAARLAGRMTPALATLVLLFFSGCRRQEPLEAARSAAELDAQIDWSRARLIAVQEGGRYKTLDSFARESFSDMTGREHLPGLSPLASLMEWLFHRDAYQDTPLLKVRSDALRARLALPLSEEKRQRIAARPYFTPRELLSTEVERVLHELESKPMMRSAVNRVRNAQVLAQRLEDFVALVPQPGGDAVAPWFTPLEAMGSLSDAQLQELGLARTDLPPQAWTPIPGLTPEAALRIVTAWTSLRACWLRAEAAGVQRYLDQLSELLPTLAGPGVYPRPSQLQAEARYYAAGKFTYGWVLYFVALLLSVAALVTGWRTPWILTLALLVAGLAVHAYGISLRWYILGRIPVANMFEAVVASSAVGVAVAALVEVFLGTRVLLVGAATTGFLALLAGQYVLPGAELSTIPAILDDIQLRLHTVMIITAYALIFVAAVVAVIYLIGYYAVRLRGSGAPSAAAAVVASRVERPILAGATPGDEGRATELPGWLNNIDWSHLIILNMVLILLFVGGVVLGAWWADYSWGRPWGWDPKEVFALNTWIIYAILLHTRFVARNRGLWTAWLSIAGCLMMAFNWFFVNFFIASVHSYA